MTDNTNNQPSPAAAPTKTAKVWPLWLLSLITLLLLGAASFYGWHQLGQVNNIQAEFKQMHEREQQLRQQNDRLSTELRDLSQQRLKLQQEQIAQSQKLSEISTRLLQMGGATRTEWLLAEAEYLMRLANQRLNIEKDIRGATKVLQAADAVLLDSGDAGLFDVRKQLQEELLALQMTSDSDIEGVYLQLEAVIGGVEKLEQSYFLKHEKKQTGDIAKNASEYASAAQQNTAWDKVVAELSKLIVFRKVNQQVEPLLSPDQTFYLKQNLRLMLEKAQLAALKRNNTLYKDTLSKAQGWITEYFIETEKPVSAIQKQLTSLAERNVDPSLPDISSSLNLLKARIQLLYKQKTIPTPTNDTVVNGGAS